MKERRGGKTRKRRREKEKNAWIILPKMLVHVYQHIYDMDSK